jgi:hypothetical protein
MNDNEFYNIALDKLSKSLDMSKDEIRELQMNDTLLIITYLMPEIKLWLNDSNKHEL